MKKTVLEVGKTYGRLTVLENLPSVDGKSMCRCRCSCGKEVVKRSVHVKNGLTKSCGCLYLDHARNMNRKHGCYKERLYATWLAMLNRCRWPGHPSYKNYGARGIRVCKAWEKDYRKFRAWAMSHGYRDDLTIERIDNDGNYTPSNCTWVDHASQARNLRKTVWVDTDAGRMCMAEAVRHYGVTTVAIAYQRVRRHGWDALRAASTPTMQQKEKASNGL